MPGHDARLLSRLRRDARQGDQAARDQLDRLGWLARPESAAASNKSDLSFGAPPPDEPGSAARPSIASPSTELLDETDYTQSSFRENLFEHIFISELLQEAWVKRRQVIDVLRSEVDSSGYDLVLVSGTATRHVQLKSSREGSKRRDQTVNAKLAERPGGCVVWMFIQEDRLAGRISMRFEFFGGRPDQRLPLDESRHKIAKHTKANAQGVKAERPMIRVVPRSDFVPVEGVEDLLERLFEGSRIEQAEDN